MSTISAIDFLYFAGYDIIVIDAAYYSKADIDKLHQQGVLVYSYLNIGSLVDFRDFFLDYKHLTLGKYENWQGEYWVDVSETEWQDHILEQAGLLVKKDVDGICHKSSLRCRHPCSAYYRGQSGMRIHKY